MHTIGTMNLHLAGTNTVAQPVYFRSGESVLFGWLHTAHAKAKGSRGVVICNPFGYEYICAHRSVREYAEAIAATGIPVLRFDYSGTGDSADSDESADQIGIWSNDVTAAVSELRRLTGVDRTCLLGIRLGTLLATVASAQCPSVDSLIMIGPIVSGRRYVRELRTAQLAGLALMAAQVVDAAPQSKTKSGTGLEAGGFTLSSATVESLALVNLQTSVAPPVRSILIIDSDKLPSGRQWADSLSNAGVNLEYKVLPGLIDMVMTAPQLSKLPRAMIEAAPEWLTTLPISAGPERSVPSIW